jgi:hypothetical protein
MDVKGVEVTLNTTPIKTADLTWDFGFNILTILKRSQTFLRTRTQNLKGLT